MFTRAGARDASREKVLAFIVLQARAGRFSSLVDALGRRFLLFLARGAPPYQKTTDSRKAAPSSGVHGIKLPALDIQADAEFPDGFPDVVAGDFQRGIVAKIPQA